MDGRIDGLIGARDDSLGAVAAEAWVGCRKETPAQEWEGKAYFLWLSVSVIPWAETLK